MLTKEECEEALENAVDTKIIIKDWKVLNKLIEEHFDPKPYTLKDLKEGMWVWDDKLKSCFEIFDIHKEDMSVEVVIHDRGVEYRKVVFLCKFEPNRFYPPNKAIDREE